MNKKYPSDGSNTSHKAGPPAGSANTRKGLSGGAERAGGKPSQGGMSSNVKKALMTGGATPRIKC